MQHNLQCWQRLNIIFLNLEQKNLEQNCLLLTSVTGKKLMLSLGQHGMLTYYFFMIGLARIFNPSQTKLLLQTGNLGLIYC